MSNAASHADAGRTVNDLAAALDLDEAGLREAAVALRHGDLVADLGDVLDIEAGLSAIVPSAAVRTPARARARREPRRPGR